MTIKQRFDFLAETRNLAAIDCLAKLIRSPSASTRWLATVALTKRSEAKAIETILSHVDDVQLSDRQWKTIAYRLVPSILRVCESSSHPLFRHALKAIVLCSATEGFPILIRAAEQTTLPHGHYSGHLLIGLAAKLGAEFVESGIVSSSRERLIHLLIESLYQFSTHRCNAIIDAYLACSHYSDAHLHSIINDSNDKILRLLVRHWKTTLRTEALDLLANLLWKHYLPKPLLDVIFLERRDVQLAVALAKCTRRDLNDSVRERLRKFGIPECCSRLDPNDKSLPNEDRYAIWLLMAACNGPIAQVFRGIHQFLLESTTDSEIVATEILKHYAPRTHSQMTTLAGVGEDAADNRSSFADPVQLAESAAIRSAVDYMFLNFDRFSVALQNALRNFFQDFQCDTLIARIDVEDDEYIQFFAKIVVKVELDWEDSLIANLQSNIAITRYRAAVTAGYMPVSVRVKQELTNLLNDEKIVIQEEAAYALSLYTKNENADLKEGALVRG